jgi:hypothetical protein
MAGQQSKKKEDEELPPTVEQAVEEQIQSNVSDTNTAQTDTAARSDSGPVVTNDPVQDTSGPTGVDRTIGDDATRVQTEISRIPDKVFRMMKNAALSSPSKFERKGAEFVGFYGGKQHRDYGAYIEHLTGGAITAEEAMAMNPTGGIAGPGLIGISFESGPMHEHAIRHDATGFLWTFFNIGPGYGGNSPTSPLSGQVEGIRREIQIGKSELPDASGVGKPVEQRRAY